MIHILCFLFFSVGLLNFSTAQTTGSEEFIMRNNDNSFYIKFVITDYEYNIFMCQDHVRDCKVIGGQEPVSLVQIREAYEVIEEVNGRPTHYAGIGALAGIACAAARVCPEVGKKIFISIIGGAGVGYAVGKIPQGELDGIAHSIIDQKDLINKVIATMAEAQEKSLDEVYVNYNLEDVVELYSKVKLLALKNK